MRNLFLILLFALFTAGCGQTLKNSWGNFRAYYNTYYNAEKNFQAGLKKVKKQKVAIDPEAPVRIHPAPVPAGNSDFQKAIDKGAQILRKFSGSKWVDDALFLIGKSYYYREEFYPALQKFEELREVTSSPKMERLAIIWKGRTLLDLKLYDEGTIYLESEIEQYPHDGSKAHKAEMQALLAEHNVMLEKWEEAENNLLQAVSALTNKNLLGPTLFLYGQVLEELQRYGEAYYIYAKVSETFPGFEYSYWARFKQAEVARKNGNLEIAQKIYQELQKDDKNYRRRGELAFEIARTLEAQEKFEQAEQRYKKLLYSNDRQQTEALKGDIYYRLGKIYSDHYANFALAAAYFDSSSTFSDASKDIEESQDPQKLAKAYGKYTSLHQSIKRADSLLYLGQLSPEELDSVLLRFRAQIRNELREGKARERANTLANRNIVQNSQQSGLSGSFGFLNHRNAGLVDRDKVEFRIIWGERPLVDNWRRMEVVRKTGVGKRYLSEGGRQVAAEESSTQAVDMELGEIPRTAAQKEDLQRQKIKAQYELGNLLFLSLNSPDSARVYFQKVMSDSVGQGLRPKAMYSLFELFKTQGNQDSLSYWANRIRREYPDSRYARSVQRWLGDEEAESDSAGTVARKFNELFNSDDPDKAYKMRMLALANRSSEEAPHIYYEAIKAYIRNAKQKDRVNDTLAISLHPDTSAVDSTAIVKGVKQQFRGAHWDSVRAVIQEFDTTFVNAEQRKKVAMLQDMLKQPDESAQLPTCKELGISLSVVPGMEEFLSSVQYPEKLKGVSLSGQIVYSFTVTASGKIESYKLVSQRTTLGIEEAFERAFEQSLQFAPLKFENPPKIQCEVTFPIRH